jgi:hypothetical protein
MWGSVGAAAAIGQILAKSKQSAQAARVSTATTPSLADSAAALRDFNRFYTRRIGVLGESLLDSRFSLTEARLLWELAHRPAVSAGALARELGLDAGYLSRLIKGLRAQGLVRAGP